MKKEKKKLNTEPFFQGATLIPKGERYFRTVDEGAGVVNTIAEEDGVVFKTREGVFFLSRREMLRLVHV